MGLFIATALYFLLVWLAFLVFGSNYDCIVTPFLVLCSIVCPLCRCTPSCTHLYLIVYSVLKHCAHTSCCLLVIAFALLMYYYVPSCVHSVVALHRVHTYIWLFARSHIRCTHIVRSLYVPLPMYLAWPKCIVTWMDLKVHHDVPMNGPKGPSCVWSKAPFGMKKYPAVAGYLIKMEQSSTKKNP
jgi:hypothetical protein